MTWFENKLDHSETILISLMHLKSKLCFITYQEEVPADAKWEKCRILHNGRLFCDVELATDMKSYHHVPRRFIRPLASMLHPTRALRSSKKKRQTRSTGCHNCTSMNPCHATISMSICVRCVVADEVVENPLASMLNPTRTLRRSSRKKRQTRSAGRHNCTIMNLCHATISMSICMGCVVADDDVEKKKPRLTNADSGTDDKVWLLNN